MTVAVLSQEKSTSTVEAHDRLIVLALTSGRFLSLDHQLDKTKKNYNMTEAFSDENLKRFIILTISHPPSQNVMSKWNTNNPQRGIVGRQRVINDSNQLTNLLSHAPIAPKLNVLVAL